MSFNQNIESFLLVLGDWTDSIFYSIFLSIFYLSFHMFSQNLAFDPLGSVTHFAMYDEERYDYSTLLIIIDWYFYWFLLYIIWPFICWDSQQSIKCYYLWTCLYRWACNECFSFGPELNMHFIISRPRLENIFYSLSQHHWISFNLCSCVCAVFSIWTAEVSNFINYFHKRKPVSNSLGIKSIFTPE